MACCWLIIFQGNAANKLGLVHCSGSACLQWLRAGPLCFWTILPLNLDGPIAQAGTASDGPAFAHSFVGQLIFWVWLPMHWDWPIFISSNPFRSLNIGLLLFRAMLITH